MPDECANCGAVITEGGLIKAPNLRLRDETVKVFNFLEKTSYSELCEKCGQQPVEQAFDRVRRDIAGHQGYVKNHISDFPMMTVGQLPPQARYRVKTMLTANVSVGTGLFNELSQGFSDMFGAINTDTGMAHKVNSGEAAARSILVQKALAIGANAIIGVDIDYGTTANNAATVNMQGTAVLIENLEDVLDATELDNAGVLHATIVRTKLLQGWLKGDLVPEKNAAN